MAENAALEFGAYREFSETIPLQRYGDLLNDFDRAAWSLETNFEVLNQVWHQLLPAQKNALISKFIGSEFVSLANHLSNLIDATQRAAEIKIWELVVTSEGSHVFLDQVQAIGWDNKFNECLRSDRILQQIGGDFSILRGGIVRKCDVRFDKLNNRTHTVAVILDANQKHSKNSKFDELVPSLYQAAISVYGSGTTLLIYVDKDKTKLPPNSLIALAVSETHPKFDSINSYLTTFVDNKGNKGSIDVFSMPNVKPKIHKADLPKRAVVKNRKVITMLEIRMSLPCTPEEMTPIRLKGRHVGKLQMPEM